MATLTISWIGSSCYSHHTTSCISSTTTTRTRSTSSHTCSHDSCCCCRMITAIGRMVSISCSRWSSSTRHCHGCCCCLMLCKCLLLLLLLLLLLMLLLTKKCLSMSPHRVWWNGRVAMGLKRTSAVRHDLKWVDAATRWCTLMEDYRLKRKSWYQMGTAVRSNRLVWGKGPLVSEEKGPTTRNSGCVVLQASWVKSHHVIDPAPNHDHDWKKYVRYLLRLPWKFRHSFSCWYLDHLLLNTCFSLLLL